MPPGLSKTNGRANVPCTVTCGSEHYVKVLRPEDGGALISLKTFMSQESRKTPMLTEDQVRRTLRESGVQRVTRGDSELEVTKPQDVDLEIDGIEVKTKARVVIHGNFNEGIVLGKEELRCWNVRSNEVGDRKSVV